MTSIPDFPVRDLKYEAITKCAHEDWNLPNVKNANLEPVLISFRANIGRVRFLMLLPTVIAGQMALTQRVGDIAEYEITGKVIRDELSLPPEVQKKIEKHRVEMLEAHKKETLKKFGTPEWHDLVGDFHLNAAKALTGLTETPLGAYGFVEQLAASITGTWTAIETMLGDLWEAALNCHPNILASLKGKPNRIGKADLATSDQKGGPPDSESKSVPLYLIETNNFDLRTSMGTVFRRQRRFEFTRLSTIREAYSRAFSEKSGRIDSALSNKSFDALSAVRNVLVHKAGRADAEYLRHSSYLDIPKSEIGKPVLLDGQIVANLIDRVMASTKSHVIAVDDWIEQN